MDNTKKLIYFKTKSSNSHLNQTLAQTLINRDFEVSPPSEYEIIKDIPEEMTTTNKKNAKIIVEIIYSKIQIGHYSNTATFAYRPICTIQIINTENGAILASRSFTGTMPPEKITVNNQYQSKSSIMIGEYPYERLKRYLNHKILDQKIYLKKGITTKTKALIYCLIVILIGIILIFYISK